MEKKTYQKPELKIVEFKAEKGFAYTLGTMLKIDSDSNTEAQSSNYTIWNWTGWGNGRRGGNDNF